MKLFSVLFLVSVFPGVSFAQYSAKNLNVAHLLTNGEVPTSRLTQWEKEQDQVSGHISNSKLLR